MKNGPSKNITVSSDATFGVSYSDSSTSPQIGDGSVVRAGTIIYDDVVAGSSFQTGHHALVREKTVLGDDVLVGTQTVIDGATDIGDNVNMQTGVYVPRETTIGDCVFLGPNATLLNDPYPLRTEHKLVGPTLENDVSLGGNATVLPGVTIGEKSFVAAGAVVVDDVPPETLAVGAPAEQRELTAELKGRNQS